MITEDTTTSTDNRQSFSGVYPHLAVFNQSDGECGIGAVIPWNDNLWYLTYCPHSQVGSPDMLYKMNKSMDVDIRPESIGGTPANRMIHKESNQLIIGPYFIDAQDNIRVIPVDVMPGRLTGVCRHLSDPENMVYIYTMEGELFEVNVHTLAVTSLFKKPVPGWHGKGLYKSQGRIVISNNGGLKVGKKDDSLFYQVEDVPETPERLGALAQWDGKTWELIERRQHTEVTGPGGIYGNADDSDPIWVTGWDRKSALLKVLDDGTWHRYRLPKANYTYDGWHGWHTEWPRIREVADGFLMMDLHGMFFEFPASFSAKNTSGIRPLSSHHQMVVDYCEWQGRTALACNHASHFDNPLLGRCHSNLWFLEKETWNDFGPRSGFGGVWIDDNTEANEASEPFLIKGFDRKVVHLSHKSDSEVTLIIEADVEGNGQWKEQATVSLQANGYQHYHFPEDFDAEWVRIKTVQAANEVTAYFHLTEDPANRKPLEAGQVDAFKAVQDIDNAKSLVGGIIRPMGDVDAYPQEETRLQYIAQFSNASGEIEEKQYIIDQDMVLEDNNDPVAFEQFKNTLDGNVDRPDFGIDENSVWIEEAGQRFRLPKSNSIYDAPFVTGWPRGQREIITERSVWNIHGSFYEIPRENSFGVRHLRPICTHNKCITDYCTWRGMLTISGIDPNANQDEHFVASTDGKAGLWFGAVDDLWKLGKPVGQGGPWSNTAVEAGEYSDPYLMTGYDKKELTLSHDADSPVTIEIQVDPTGYGEWLTYESIVVDPGTTYEHPFATAFSAHWIRFSADKSCKATATLRYS